MVHICPNDDFLMMTYVFHNLVFKLRSRQLVEARRFYTKINLFIEKETEFSAVVRLCVCVSGSHCCKYWAQHTQTHTVARGKKGLVFAISTSFVCFFFMNNIFHCSVSCFKVGVTSNIEWRKDVKNKIKKNKRKSQFGKSCDGRRTSQHAIGHRNCFAKFSRKQQTRTFRTITTTFF